MFKIRAIVYAGMPLLAALLLGAVFLSAQAQDETREATPFGVPVQKIKQSQSTKITTSYAGVIRARRTSQLGFERGGLVVSVSADLGKHVHQGDVLARLDSEALRADLAAARASVNQAEAQRRIAQSTYTRQKALLAKGHISAQRLEEIDAKLLAADAAQRVAEAQVKTLQARLARLQIIAPYDGVIAERYIDEGSIATSGAPVFTLVEDAILEVRVGLPTTRLADIKIGEIFDFSTAGTQFKARLRGLSGKVDTTTQTVSALFDVEPGAGTLVPGQSARLMLDVPLEQAGFWVPISALREDRRGLWSLFALDNSPANDGLYILTPRLVEVLYAGAEQVYVRGPVKDGTLILAGGNQSVSAGMSVVPATPNQSGQP
ncbi:MAG: efflux RND transporter periplasmic adaptor subunit [Robiginitomaculum sp.]|nr:efflux RND transporter periplasmic adaptor subunit [Robiginitomaculum sp.]MDQ7077921.1 efflux RND transporter periplasmic adaptor subunit [Robiginitomaculum sp.]